MKRLSELSIVSFGVWVRIFDIPANMVTDGFPRALGGKIGKVLEGVLDYKRVKVEFPLEKPIMRSVEQKVRGYGLLEFEVQYENIPNFCF